MVAWVIALAVGLLLAALQYAHLVARDGAGAVLLAALRAGAVALVVALLLDACAGPARLPPPLVALDASLSWTRGGDSARWTTALARARELGGDSVLLAGDSLRLAGDMPRPADFTSALGPLVEQAAAQARPVVFVTDGEIAAADAGAARALPTGSRFEVLAAPAAVDVAVVAMSAPRSAALGDTLRVAVTVRNGAAPVPASTMALQLDATVVATVTLPALDPHATREVDLSVWVTGGEGPRVLRATVSASGDAERRNDTAATALDVSSAAGAVWISSAPDLDGRAAVAVLRQTLGAATRGYLRIAPGTWRIEGTLAPVSEAIVRQAAVTAPILLIHGDTAVFGPPRALAGDAPLALMPGVARQPAVAGPAALDEWYPSSAPSSPAAVALAGVPWDSLPPVSLGAAAGLGAPAGGWVAVAARRARRGDAVPLVVGTDSPRRVVVQRATGLWRWRARGGPGVIAYDALWGSLFDWMADARRDRRTAIPERAAFREGAPVTWRLSAGTDSAIAVRLTRRDDPARVEVLSLVARPGTIFAESPPLPAGVYDVRAAGGSSALVVNVADELLPRAPVVRDGRVGDGAVSGRAPVLRDYGLAYALVVLLLCVEWALRRQRGLL